MIIYMKWCCDFKDASSVTKDEQVLVSFHLDTGFDSFYD